MVSYFLQFLEECERTSGVEEIILEVLGREFIQDLNLTKRTSSFLASISSVWNVFGGSRDLCIPGKYAVTYIA